jgi:hypothetical protein
MVWREIAHCGFQSCRLQPLMKLGDKISQLYFSLQSSLTASFPFGGYPHFSQHTSFLSGLLGPTHSQGTPSLLDGLWLWQVWDAGPAAAAPAVGR